MASNLHNVASTAIADEYGTIAGQIDLLEKRKSELKAELVARSVEHVEGARFTVTVSEQVSKRLDTKALKDALGPNIIAEYERETTSQVVRVKATVVAPGILEAA